MVYNNKLIVVIKNKGKVLREFSGGVVRLPFGSDYSIYIKNKDTIRKVLVDVKVDGKDTLDGSSLIVDPKRSTELKGFMKGSTVRNKFRFIEKTKEISNYRGDFVEDGLVEVTYKFEEYNDWWNKPILGGYVDTHVKSFRRDSSADHHVYYSNISSSTEPMATANCSYNDSGITVPGAETRQDFVVGNIGRLESTTYNIVLNLKGQVVERRRDKRKQRVKRPITVKTKIRCSTCGRRWRSSMKYCGNCSTYLH